MEIGKLLEIDGHIVEVCKSLNQACTGCIAVGKNSLCRKMPECPGLYFRRLNNFDIRKAKREKKQIEKYERI